MTPVVLHLDEPVFSLFWEKARHAGIHPDAYGAQMLKRALEQLPPAGRSIVLSGGPLEVLEEILGGGSLLSQDDLLKKVRRLAGVSFLHVRLPFTPNQLEELARKAESQGWTVDQLVERTAPRIYEQFFDLLART